MLLHRLSSLKRRLAVAALAIAAEWLCMLAPASHAEGVSWSGVMEGSVVHLLPGATSTNLSITAIPESPSAPTNLLFNLERQGKVLLNRTAGPPYSLTFSNLPPGKYFLIATLDAPGLPTVGDLSFDIALASTRPANDDWSQASTLAASGAPATGSNLGATREASEPALNEGGAGKSIWWAWRAESSGTFTATTAGSSFDTVLGVYTGAELSTLALVGANDDVGPHSLSQATFQAVKDVAYYFSVDSAAENDGGQARLQLIAGSPPSVAITSPPDGHLMLVASSLATTNLTATITAGDPSGISSVNYWFDGGTNSGRSGALTEPYQLALANLSVGHYLLTVAASNNAGLASVVHTGFSVISLEPVLVMERSGSKPGIFQMAMTGFKGPKYTLQSSTNLDAWCGTSSWTNFPGAVKVADTNAGQIQPRFFRAVSAQ